MNAKKLILVSALSMALAAPAMADYDDDSAELELHAKVKAALIDHEGLDARDINIEVDDGVVQISGFVADEATKEAANDLLAGTEGMVKLSNQLVVKREMQGIEARTENTVLAGKVKAAIFDNDIADADQVLVEVRDETVLLSGFVDNEEKRQQALMAARNVEGVQEVIDGMDLDMDDDDGDVPGDVDIDADVDVAQNDLDVDVDVEEDHD